MNYIDVFLVTGFSFAIISIVISLITIFLQLWVPKLRRFPGILITMQCISQVFYDIHWLPVLPSINASMKANYPTICEIWGMVTMFFYFLGYNYATCLSFEIIFKLSHRVNIHYKTRMWAYHLTTWLLSIVFCVLLYIYNAYGISGLQTCSVSNSHVMHSLEYAPFILNLPIMWFSVIYAIRKLEQKYISTVMNFMMVVLSVSLTWFLPTFFKLIVVLTGKTGNWTFIAFFIGTLSGTSVGLSRLINKKVIKDIKKHYEEWTIELKSFDVRRDRVETCDRVEYLLDFTSSLFGSEELDIFTNFHESISKQVNSYLEHSCYTCNTNNKISQRNEPKINIL